MRGNAQGTYYVAECLEILSAHFDLGDLDEEAKLELQTCLNGGPLSILFDVDYLASENFPLAADQYIQSHPELGLTPELLINYLQETKQIYEEFTVEVQNLGSSTRSHAFRETLMRLGAMQGRDILPQDKDILNAGLKIILQIIEDAKAGKQRFEMDEPTLLLLYIMYQVGSYLIVPAYPYRPLMHSIKEYRLLILMPSTTPSAAVKCRLIHNNSQKRLLYAALSYVWSEPTLPKTA
jgi:hypothetical protein